MREDQSGLVRVWFIGAVVILVCAGVVLGYWRSWQGPSGTRGTVAQQERATLTRTALIPVDGMICMSCAASVRRKTTSIHGVRTVEVDLAARRVRVEYVEGSTSPEHVAAAIRELGYKTGSPVLTPRQ